MQKVLFYAGILASLAVTLSACVIDREYQVALTYRPSAGYNSNGPATLAIAPFSDNRTEKKLLFKKHNHYGGEDRYYLEDEKLDLQITNAIKAELQKSGIGIVELPSWDRTAESLPGIAQDFVLTGAIEEFSCRKEIGSNPLSPYLSGRMRITVTCGDKKTGIVKEQRFETAFQSEEFLAVSQRDVQEILNAVVQKTMDKIITGTPLIGLPGANVMPDQK